MSSVPLSQQVSASGVFELRLKSFINDYGKDSLGLCCSGEQTEPCRTPCRTRFRVCLKHYQARVDTTSPCTFGDVVTPVLGDNSLQLDAAPAIEGFSNPIRFPFDFTWPVSALSFSSSFSVGAYNSHLSCSVMGAYARIVSRFRISASACDIVIFL